MPDDTFGRGVVGFQRLTRAEYTRALGLLLGVTGLNAEIEAALPADSRAPFDNDYSRQPASKPLIEGYQVLAEKAASLVVADPTKKAAVVGCRPANETDAACFRSFLTRLGRRVIRRPLATAELDAYAALLTSPAAQGKFDTAVGLAIRALLQAPEFLYRIENGTQAPAPGEPLTLTAFELASRLSFTIWSEPPDEALLDAAASGGLDTPDGLRAQVIRLVDSPKGQAQLARFHALLWQYDAMQISGAIANDLRQESDALIRRIVFDERKPWFDVFRSRQTYANGTLRQLYGMPLKPDAGFEWVNYAQSDQMGILSHGSVLSNGASGNDTSPVFRGKFIREHVLCQRIPPPPIGVTANLSPTTENMCKTERLAVHRSAGDGCAGCHALMDPIGFGLERYNPIGAYRTAEPGKPQCALDGRGELVETGTSFQGPKGLAELLLQDERTLAHCMLSGLYGYALGRSALVPADAKYVDALLVRFMRGNQDLRQLWVDWLSDPSIRTRAIDEVTL
jgi:hypothetical protein